MTFHFAKDKFWKLDIIGYPLLQVDKWVHLLGCAFLFSLAYLLMSKTGGVHFGTKHLAAFWAFIGGLGVEIVQGFGKEGFSWRDLIADCIGIGTLWWMAV